MNVLTKSQENLLLVIPTLREAANLPTLLARVQTSLDSSSSPWEVVVVDDDSRDGTAELVNAFSAKDPRFRLLVRKGERGLAGAILHGWQNSRAELLGVMDADLQHPPHILPQLLDAIAAGHDLVIGSRYVAGAHLGTWNRLRAFLSAAAVWITRAVQKSCLRVHDPLSGFFLIRRRCLQDVQLQTSGFKLLLEILVRAHVHSVVEVPIRFGVRSHGRSKAGLRVACDYLQLLLRLYSDRLLQRTSALRERRTLPDGLPAPHLTHTDA